MSDAERFVELYNWALIAEADATSADSPGFARRSAYRAMLAAEAAAIERAAGVIEARAAEYRSAQVGCSLNEALGLEKMATELDRQTTAIRSFKEGASSVG